MRMHIAIGALLLSGLAHAELDGSKILLEEAERAKEIQRLQYQAELLKQRAEIAKYVDQIKESGGDLSDLGISSPSQNTAPVKASPSVSGVSNAKKADQLPKLVHIEKDRAAFETEQGKVSGTVGQTLPGGYRIVSVNMRDGVRLQKNGMKYDIDVAW